MKIRAVISPETIYTFKRDGESGYKYVRTFYTTEDGYLRYTNDFGFVIESEAFFYHIDGIEFTLLQSVDKRVNIVILLDTER